MKALRPKVIILMDMKAHCRIR